MGVRVYTVVNVPLEDIIHRDFEQFIDLLLEKAGEPLGMDVHYSLVDVEDSTDELIFDLEYDKPPTDDGDLLDLFVEACEKDREYLRYTVAGYFDQMSPNTKLELEDFLVNNFGED